MNLRELISSCQNCPLRAKLNNYETPLFGVGSSKPLVMIIIDGPTKENINLLDSFSLLYMEKKVAEYKIDKSKLYITPYVKCPRVPTVKSKKICIEWLKKEVELFKPSIVIGIGKFKKEDFMTHHFDVSFKQLAIKTTLDKLYGDSIFSVIRDL